MSCQVAGEGDMVSHTLKPNFTSTLIQKKARGFFNFLWSVWHHCRNHIIPLHIIPMRIHLLQGSPLPPLAPLLTSASPSPSLLWFLFCSEKGHFFYWSWVEVYLFKMHSLLLAGQQETHHLPLHFSLAPENGQSWRNFTYHSSHGSKFLTMAETSVAKTVKSSLCSRGSQACASTSITWRACENILPGSHLGFLSWWI